MWVRSKSPTKLFEYMATGLPVVADAIGEVRHVLESGISGFLAANQEEFNRAMIDLCRNHRRRLEMGIAARKRVATNFSIPVLVDRLAQFLDTLFRMQS
ncbi:glycosyltransferase [bacterium]|nr:glycosyltransferase [bacterium]